MSVIFESLPGAEETAPMPPSETTAVAGTVYGYWVRAVNAAGQGAWSDVATKIVP